MSDCSYLSSCRRLEWTAAAAVLLQIPSSPGELLYGSCMPNGWLYFSAIRIPIPNLPVRLPHMWCIYRVVLVARLRCGSPLTADKSVLRRADLGQSHCASMTGSYCIPELYSSSCREGCVCAISNGDPNGTRARQRPGFYTHI